MKRHSRRKRLIVVVRPGVSPHQPAVGHRHSRKVLEQTYRPIVALVLKSFLGHVPVGRQIHEQLGALAHMFRKPQVFGHSHAICPGAYGAKRVVVAAVGRWNYCNVKVNVRRFYLMQHIVVFAKILLYEI